MSSGSGLSTKGLAGGGIVYVEVAPEQALPPPPPAPPMADAETVSYKQIMIVIPTAVNVSLVAAENITDNLRVRRPASLELPSIYKRAFLVAHEADEIGVVKR